MFDYIKRFYNLKRRRIPISPPTKQITQQFGARLRLLSHNGRDRANTLRLQRKEERKPLQFVQDDPSPKR